MSTRFSRPVTGFRRRAIDFPRAVSGFVTGSLLAVFALSGCASHSADVTNATSTPNSSAPHRIVSLDASNTEILYAVGAGSQVVAVDQDSDYPANAAHSRLDATKPNVEAIAADHPDLVVTAYDTDNLVASLTKIGIPALVASAPSTLDQAYQIWSKIGHATGHDAQANALIANARKEIGATVAATVKPATPLRYYYELDQTYYTATSHTFIGGLLGSFGMTNIADPADSPAAGGYPQLSAEAVLGANPNLIFLADSQCCAQNAGTVAARPGWATLTAVRDNDVVALNDDIASRWGPRVVDLVRAVAAAVNKAAGRG